MSCDIHATAIVDAKAEIADEVVIGAYSIIGPHVQIGPCCRIGPHVVIEGHTQLGPENEVFQFASLGARPQDLKFRGEASTLILGSRNIIREYVTLHPGTEHGNMTTVIGDNNLLMACSHVAHDCVLGNNNVMANYVGLAGHVTIGSNANLGGMVGIHQFCRIGDYAFLSGGSMIGHDVPPYCFAQGDRCFLRGLNLIGLQRAGFTPEQISQIKKVYRILFSSGGHIRGDKRELVPADLAEQPHIKFMLDFIAASSRGVMSTARGHRESGADE